MKRILILAAVCFGLVGTASAQEPVPESAAMGAPVAGVVEGGCGGGGGCGESAGVARHDARFGWHPVFRKLAFWKRDNGRGTCGAGGGGLFGRLRGLFSGGRGAGAGGGAGGFGHGAGGPTFNPYPNGVPGTLVFPNHPFVRSPRDFFMYEGK